MSSLMLIEPHWEGHNMLYAGWIVGEAISLNYRVSLATYSAFLSHPFYRELQKEYGETLESVVLPGGFGRPPHSLAGHKFRYYRLFSKLYRDLADGRRPDGIFVPYMDYFTHAVGLLGSPFGDTPWGGIVIDPDFHLRSMGIKAPRTLTQQIKEKLFFRMLSDESLMVVFTLDELLVEYALLTSPELSGKLCYLPEPSSLAPLPSPSEARRELGIPLDATVIMVYGVLDHSKGLDALLAALQNTEIPDELVLFVAGPQDQEIRRLLATREAEALRSSARLYEWDEFLYGEKESAAFAASDIVWVGYRGQHISSGVLIQAGIAGRPIIACDEGLIGWHTQSKRLGLTVNISDTSSVSQALVELAGRPDLTADFALNGREYARLHTSERFKETLGEELPKHFPI